MFQVSKEECLRCQIVTLNEKQGHHLKYLPYAFTENGVAMLSGVLRSEGAIAVNIQIMRTFVAMRHAIASFAPLLARIEANERRQIVDQAKNDANQARNEERFEKIFGASLRDLGKKCFAFTKLDCDDVAGASRPAAAARAGGRDVCDGLWCAVPLLRFAPRRPAPPRPAYRVADASCASDYLIMV